MTNEVTYPAAYTVYDTLYDLFNYDDPDFVGSVYHFVSGTPVEYDSELLIPRLDRVSYNPIEAK